MNSKILELRIAELILAHREVSKDRVEANIQKFKRNEYIHPVSVDYCVHRGKYYLSKGHHRVVAAWQSGKESIVAEVNQCYLWNCEGEGGEGPFSINHIILE